MSNILPVPESEQRVLNNLLKNLNEAYPDKVIRNLGRDHKKWDEKVTRLYKNIGYENRNEFLAAYGFTVEHGKGGRPSNDLNAIVEELINRYEGEKYASNIDQLKDDNPDLAPKLKNIQNKSKELFGMSFNKYLKEKGVILSDKDSAEQKKDVFQEKLEVILKELKTRYAEQELPKTLAELKKNNYDIENISNLTPWISKVYGRAPAEYLKELGLLHIEEKQNDIDDSKPEKNSKRTSFSKISIEEQLKLLQQKYEGRLQKPTNMEDLIADNLDLSIRSFYKNLKASVDDPFLYLLESGVFSLFRFNNGMVKTTTPYLNKNHGITTLEVPDGSTGILEGSLDCTGITEVIIPDTVKYIGYRAFDYSAANVQTIRFGKGIRVLGCEPFGPGVSSLKEIVLHDGVERISGSLFSEFNFTIGDQGAYGKRNKLERIVIEGRVKEFSAEIFAGVPSHVLIDCPQEMISALKMGINREEYNGFIWDELKEEYIPELMEPISEASMLEQYGIPNDDPFADVVFLDAPEEIIIAKNNFCFSGVYSDYSNSVKVPDQSYLEYIITQNGGELKNSISGTTDYLVVIESQATDRMRYNGVRYRNAYRKLKIVDARDFEKLISGKYKVPKDSDIVKNHLGVIQEAVSLYKRFVFELESVGADSWPVLLDSSTDRYPLIGAEDYEKRVQVEAFFREIGLNDYSYGRSYLGYGTVGIEYPLASIVAQHVICKELSSGKMVFARDKWEFRGDYSSADRPAFKWSADFSECKAYREKGYEKYDM